MKARWSEHNMESIDAEQLSVFICHLEADSANKSFRYLGWKLLYPSLPQMEVLYKKCC